MRRWVGDPPDLGPFHFGPSGAPLEVIVRHRIVEPGKDGPRTTGTWLRRYVGGVLMEERTEPGAAP